MKFLWCTIYVKDMEKSLRFYEEIVGLTIERRHAMGPNGEIVFLGKGETKVELIYDKTHIPPQEHNSISLGFEVDSVDEMIKFIEQKGLKVIKGPIMPNPNIKFFFIKDPNGLDIQFAEIIK